MHDDPQALETCTTVIWIDRLRNIKQRKCWQHSAGLKIGNYKKSLERITRTSSCVHLANSYDFLFLSEQNVIWVSEMDTRWRASNTFQGFLIVPDLRSWIMLSTLPLFYITQCVNSDDRRAGFHGLRIIISTFFGVEAIWHPECHRCLILCV